jgi:hypothetical protein
LDPLRDYYRPLELGPHRLGPGGNGVFEDTQAFHENWPPLARQLASLGIQPPPIFNVNPESHYTVFPRIDLAGMFDRLAHLRTFDRPLERPEAMADAQPRTSAAAAAGDSPFNDTYLLSAFIRLEQRLDAITTSIAELLRRQEELEQHARGSEPLASTASGPLAGRA